MKQPGRWTRSGLSAGLLLFILQLLALLASGSVHASFSSPPAGVRAENGAPGGYVTTDIPLALKVNLVYYNGWTSTWVSECTMTSQTSSGGSTGFGTVTGTCRYKPGGTGTGSIYSTTVDKVGAGSCPVNSTGTGTCTCNAGYDEVISSGVGSCVAHVNVCTPLAGTPQIQNITTGWGRSNSVDSPLIIDYLSESFFRVPMCSGGCKVKLGDVQAAWRAQEPTSTGLYRSSADFMVERTGEECTASAEEKVVTDPTAVPPVCQGTHGEVNGKPVCLGSNGDLNVVQAITAPKYGGNPPSGPSNGSAPSSRTPTSGNGGNAGGPNTGANSGAQLSGSGTGQNGSGTVSKPGEGKEQQACGAPGQPVCAVKFDEAGVNTTVADGLKPLNDAAQAHGDLVTGIQSSVGKDASWGVMPKWFTRGACVPLDLGTWPVINKSMTFNLCPALAIYDVLASLAMVILTFAACTGMVRDTIAGA